MPSFSKKLAAATALGAAFVAVAACGKPRGTCVWAAGGGSAFDVCRDDATQATCVATADDARPAVFTRGQTCPKIGFACIGDAFDASFRRTRPDGTCPPRSSLVP